MIIFSIDGVIPTKADATSHHAQRAVAIVLNCPQILTTCPKQEFVRQSYDQNQTFTLGQNSPWQNKLTLDEEYNEEYT